MEGNSTLLIWFVGLTGAAVLLQACVLLGIFIALRKTAQAVDDVTKDMKSTVIPLVHSIRDLLEKVSPQVQTVSSGLANLTEIVQKETSSARNSVADIAARGHAQVQRIDHMLTTALDAVEKAAGAIENSVAAPVRQVNGVVAALKAVIGTYRATPGTPRSSSSGINGRRVRPVPDPDQDIVI